MVKNVLLLHGYSVRSMNSWGQLPALLQASGIATNALYYSAFVSLDDYVSCADLADALEAQISLLETGGLEIANTAIVAHSTGAIIARRWMLNRRKSGKKAVSHFISCAGANHGSTLAQLGRGGLAQLFRDLTEKSSVGKRVLSDLDYGSVFLRKLNREWIDAWNDSVCPLHGETFCFSLGGTDHSYWQNQLTWESRESGSDGTVRISSANLNYRIIEVTPPYETMKTIQMDKQAPHLVVHTKNKSYSHTSEAKPDSAGLVLSQVANAVNKLTHPGRSPETISASVDGILEGIQNAGERPYKALLEAMNVHSSVAYDQVASIWTGETQAWSQAYPSETCSTIVAVMRDSDGRLVDDSLILLRDYNDGTIAGISQSILGNQPIRNEDTPSVLSFYVKSKEFSDVHPHGIYAEAKTDTEFVSYDLRVNSPLSDGEGPNASHVIAANEFTYIDITTTRDASKSLVFIAANHPNINELLNKAFPPLPTA